MSHCLPFRFMEGNSVKTKGLIVWAVLIKSQLLELKGTRNGPCIKSCKEKSLSLYECM